MQFRLTYDFSTVDEILFSVESTIDEGIEWRPESKVEYHRVVNLDHQC